MKLLLNKSKQSGAQMVEYLVLIGLVLLSVFIAIEAFGDQINTSFDVISGELLGIDNVVSGLTPSTGG